MKRCGYAPSKKVLQFSKQFIFGSKVGVGHSERKKEKDNFPKDHHGRCLVDVDLYAR